MGLVCSASGGRRGPEGCVSVLSGDARGHDLVALRAGLTERLTIEAELPDRVAELGKHYIATRYPNAHAQGPPFRHYTLGEAKRAIENAEEVLRFCAEVTWLDRRAVLNATGKAVQMLARQRPEVQRVILFGSMARGDAVPGSDVDLLVVLSESDRSFLDRIASYRLSGVPIGVDVFPYTEDELAQMLGEDNGFARQALAEGTVLFDRSGDETS